MNTGKTGNQNQPPTLRTSHAHPIIPTKLKKDPMGVAVYNENKPIPQNYKVIGKETVSQYNSVGIKRQVASVKHIMRELAAAIGGDAVINVHRNDNTIQGTIIAYG